LFYKYLFFIRLDWKSIEIEVGIGFLAFARGIRLAMVFLGIGSNIGDRAGYLTKTRESLAELTGCSILNCSSVYESDPWGLTDQAPFLNQVVALETALEPRSLLEACQTIERRLGRMRGEKWGPRTIDIDILLFDSLVVEKDGLRIPHPRMMDRRFVLVPLAEIAADRTVPPGSRTVSELLASCGDGGGVRPYHEPDRGVLEDAE
jgi:2-amino-4-hydroxy-6-hydroxymethyldihydropteridine diphosphokinase